MNESITIALYHTHDNLCIRLFRESGEIIAKAQRLVKPCSRVAMPFQPAIKPRAAFPQPLFS
jgi:hypothetical protein